MRTSFFDRRLAFEIAPAVVLFLCNVVLGLRYATFAAIAATIFVTVVDLATFRRIPWLAVVSCIMMIVFGLLTLIFDDVRFIKVKLTIGKLLFGATLTAGLMFRPTFLQRMLGGLLQLTPKGWRVLTLRWAAFAMAQAALNELVWRNANDEIWILFKIILIPFSVVGYILITRVTAPRWWDREAAANGS